MNRYILIGIILLIQACASPIYYAKRIQGQIVEHETGQPLEGVIVVAKWVLMHKTPSQYYHDKKLRIVETLTDQNGNYVVSGSPMIRLRPFTELADHDPVISFFKKGYTPLFVSNSSDRDTVIRYSEWNGRVLKLKHFNGTNDRYANYLRGLFNLDRSDWCFVPKLSQAMYEEVKRLNSEGFNSILLPDIPDTMPDTNEFACF